MTHDDLKRIPLHEFVVGRLNYKPVRSKDSRNWRCLISPSGVKIITKTTPNPQGHFLYRSTEGSSGTIIDLLRYEGMSWSDINSFGGVNFIPPPPIIKVARSPQWLKKQAICRLLSSVEHADDNLLTERGLQSNTLARFRVRASSHKCVFVLYRLAFNQAEGCSAITFYAHKKRFEGARGDATSLLSPLRQNELSNPSIYFFESPLDALSYTQIKSVNDNSLLVSFCGAPTHSFLEGLPSFLARWQPRRVTVCVDNDPAGLRMVKKLQTAMPLAFLDLPPSGKDWADMLEV